jgi:hypothetical protein
MGRIRHAIRGRKNKIKDRLERKESRHATPEEVAAFRQEQGLPPGGLTSLR